MPLLSFSAALTGDGGENDFSFCSDALLPRITRRCRLLAAAVSLACVTCAQRRVSDNNFVCVSVYKCPRVCVRAHGVTGGFVILAGCAEGARGVAAVVLL